LADFYTKFIKDFFCIGKIAHQLLEEKKILWMEGRITKCIWLWRENCC
jgi:hypothetical protein